MKLYGPDDEYENTPLDFGVSPPHDIEPPHRAPKGFMNFQKSERESSKYEGSMDEVTHMQGIHNHSWRRCCSFYFTDRSQNDGKTTRWSSITEEKFGWKRGEGLGREKQGNTESINVVEKFDRGSLGFAKISNGFDEKKHEVDLDKFVPHHQDFEWLQCERGDKFAEGKMEICMVMVLMTPVLSASFVNGSRKYHENREHQTLCTSCERWNTGSGLDTCDS